MRLIALLLVLAVMQAAPAPPPRPVPVAANTLANAPDSYYGQVVSITATVDRQLTPAAFVIDHDRAKSSELEVLVVAAALTSPLQPGTPITVVGEAARFDAADARRAKELASFPADLAARYQGRPAIFATSVVTASMVDLAKRVPPPMTPAEEAFDAVMKRVGPAFNGLRTAATASDAAAAAGHAKVLKSAFAEAEAFWKARGATDALDWNRMAAKQSDVLERAVRAADWAQVKTAADELNRSCSTCHTAYRERYDDGTYRVRSTR